jgi:hypothetical protein
MWEEGQTPLDVALAFFDKPLRFHGLLVQADEDDVASQLYDADLVSAARQIASGMLTRCGKALEKRLPTPRPDTCSIRPRCMRPKRVRGALRLAVIERVGEPEPLIEISVSYNGGARGNRLGSVAPSSGYNALRQSHAAFAPLEDHTALCQRSTPIIMPLKRAHWPASCAAVTSRICGRGA